MRTLWRMIALIAWALWWGGLLALFIFVVTLFHKDHDLAADAAPMLFGAFETYQLFLAPVTIAAAILLHKRLAALLILLACIGTVVSPMFITPRINQMHAAHQTHTDEFARLHGEAMMMYTFDTVVLFIAGPLLLMDCRKQSQPA